MRDIRSLTWPAASLDDAVGTLARAAGLVTFAAEGAGACATREAGRSDEAAIERAARRHGVGSRAIVAAESDLRALSGATAPMLLRLTFDGDVRFVCVLGIRRWQMRVVAPDGTRQRMAIRQVARWLAPATDANTRSAEFLARSIEGGRGITRRQRARVAAFAGAGRPGCAWALEDQAGGWRTLARDTSLTGHLWRFVILQVVQYGLWLGAWAMLLQFALHAEFGTADLRAWTLILGTIALVRAWQAQAARVAALCGGTVIKRRLLDAVLSLQPDRIRHAGAGHFLGRVLEGEAIESAGLAGAFQAMNAVIGTIVGLFVLARGAGGWLQAGLLAAWIAAIAIGSGVYYRRRRAWTELRFALTTLNVEQMVGHRTRLAQQDGSALHSAEDGLLQQYGSASARVDRAAVALDAVRRGWLYAGLLSVAAPLVAGSASSSAIAISVAGIVIAGQALASWTDSLPRLAGALIAVRSLRPFWQLTENSDQPGSRTLELSAAHPDDRASASAPALEAIGLTFTHAGRAAPSVADASLSVQAGERVLIQGGSGSGKSTLASILAGHRAPDSGLLLLNGLDVATVGTRVWRRRVALVPQFHDNHIFAGSLAFNLLMGRRWPPTRDDMDQAASVCGQLGLDSLLARMPLGLQQPVGESGWQLSHGERSRVYVARAVLQDPDVTILDETFAALDPATVEQCVNVMIDRARTFVMIAHP